MKAFTTFVVLAAAAVVSAQQPTFNSTTNEFNCPIANATYCAGDSLATNIIIRCTGFVGFPGNCNDNLDGEFPVGLNFAPCWSSPTQAGVAACSKNCVVYGGSGNFNGTFTLPLSQCVPSTTSSSGPTSTSGTSSTSASSIPTTTTNATSVTVLTTSVFTTVSSTALSTSTPPLVTGTSTTCATCGISNATSLITSGSSTGSATATPVGPTTSSRPAFTGSANANTAGVFVGAMGLLVAYLL